MHKSNSYYSIRTPSRRAVWYDTKAEKEKGKQIATCAICNQSIGQFEPRHYSMTKPQAVTCHACYLRKGI